MKLLSSLALLAATALAANPEPSLEPHNTTAIHLERRQENCRQKGDPKPTEPGWEWDVRCPIDSHPFCDEVTQIEMCHDPGFVNCQMMDVCGKTSPGYHHPICLSLRPMPDWNDAIESLDTGVRTVMHRCRFWENFVCSGAHFDVMGPYSYLPKGFENKFTSVQCGDKWPESANFGGYSL